MSDEFKSPFVPGARVAVQSGFRSDDYLERFVDKVYKNGNFTLRGETGSRPRQWRPSSWRRDGQPLEWSATQTGDSYCRTHLKFWDERADKEIREKIARAKRRERLHKIQERIHRLRDGDVTDAMLDQIEGALPQKNTSQ